MSARSLDSDLARARAAFAAWRSSRRGPGGRLPDRLWQMATSLVDHHDLTRVAHELGLEEDRLRARLAERSPSARPCSPTPAFVELRAVELMAARAALADASVQACFERPDGTRLTIVLPVARDLLDQVCAAFLRS
jgi:hypothetical protein